MVPPHTRSALADKLPVTPGDIKNRHCASRYALVAICCFGLAGCSESGVPLADVTGRVTFNGRPCPAEIMFEPDGHDKRSGGRPSSAFAGDDGRFTLNYTDERKGAVVGRHRVLIKVLRSHGSDEPQSFHEAVQPVKTARMKRHVQPGKNHFHFAITY